MANAFNDFFTNAGHNLDELIPTNKNNRNSSFIFIFPPTNPREISDIVTPNPLGLALYQTSLSKWLLYLLVIYAVYPF